MSPHLRWLTPSEGFSHITCEVDGIGENNGREESLVAVTQ